MKREAETMLNENRDAGVSEAAEARGLPVEPAWKSLVLWLVVVGLSLILLPLFLTAQTTQQDNLGLESGLSQALTEVASVPTLPVGAQQLQATGTAVQAQIDRLGPVSTQLVAGHVDWSSILAIVGGYDDTQIVLTGVTQTENRLVITGRAGSDVSVTAYAQALENSARFSRVVIQSITQSAGPTQIALQTATPTQTNGANTPQPIFMKQPLLLTFVTAQQEDTATFLAKADRFYEVSTFNLAPGVDTVLTVSLEGGPTYTNDDVGPGTLASEVTFQAPAANTRVIIRVTNQGQPGPKMSYQLLAQEIVPKTTTGSATRPAASSPAATQSATPISSPTSGPTDTPTASPTTLPTATLPPVPTLGASGGAVTFAVLVEVKAQTP
jgi:Tfp pilus assembly protein PilN